MADFNPLNFIANHAGMNLADAIKEAYEQGKRDARPERKRGKWIDETFKPWGLVYHPYKCDQCGEYSEADSNYCPNCGAQMER